VFWPTSVLLRAKYVMCMLCVSMLSIMFDTMMCSSSFDVMHVSGIGLTLFIGPQGSWSVHVCC